MPYCQHTTKTEHGNYNWCNGNQEYLVITQDFGGYPPRTQRICQLHMRVFLEKESKYLIHHKYSVTWDPHQEVNIEHLENPQG